MWQSLRISHLVLRLGLAIVFLYFGIDKFFHPTYWLNAWFPPFLISLSTSIHLSVNYFVYSMGFFELLVGISLISNMFVDFFTLLATISLDGILLFHGINENLIRDVGLIGGLLALTFWPKSGLRRYP